MSDNNPAKPQSRPRVRRGPQAMADDAIALLRHHLTQRGFEKVGLVTRWSEIAGHSLAEHCFPYRLSAGGASGSTLTLIADDRAALELQHQAPKLIDKINSYFGTAVVGKIKVVAGDIPSAARPARQLRALTLEEENDLARRVSQVEDPALRAALTRLGRNALAESRKAAIHKR